MSSVSPTPAERALAAAIYAPIGLGAKVVEDLPEAVAKARQHLVFARFIGKIAVDQSVRELRGRVNRRTNPGSAAVAGNAGSRGVDPAPPTGEVVTEMSIRAATPAPDTLALPDYDQLPAAHIVGKLGGLTASELDAVEAYESAHRHRRTVLGKISQLRGQ